MRNFWLLLVAVAAGLWFWQAESRAALSQRVLLRGLAAQLAPWGLLEHGPSRAHFWGGGSIQSLRFTPGQALADRLGLPPGSTVSIPALHYRDWDDHQRWPAQARFRFEDAEVSLPATVAKAVAGTVDWRYVTATGLLNLAFTLEAPSAGQLEGTLGLRLNTPRSFTQAVLTGATARYRDAGLAQGWRAELGLQHGADPLRGEQVMAQRLADWWLARGLPPDAATRSTLQAFARQPTGLTLRLDPPGSLRPETLPLFAPADRTAALGWQLEAP